MIPERKIMAIQQIKPLELDIEQSELILLTTSSNFDNGYRNAASLGAFNNITNDAKNNTYIDLGWFYFLRKCDKKFGGSYIPLAESKCGLISVSSLKDFYVGQDQIVSALQSWPGFEPHAEWVARLRKPYLE